MSISSDHRYVNLWDLLTDVPVSASRGMLDRRRQRGQAVKDLLNKANRINGQELSLEVSDQGWTIKVFSCFGDGGIPARALVEVYIPMDQNEAIHFLVADGHKASLYQRKWKPGKVWTQVYKFIGRTRVARAIRRSDL